MERKMVTARRIDAIEPIEGADAIEVAILGGWKVVVKKGEFTAGETALYFEIDSWVPYEIAPFLTKPGHEPKEYQGILGQRLKTIRLRGQLSQGLLLPSNVAIDKFIGSYLDDGQELSEVFHEGADVSELLGVVKWEPPAEFMPSQAKGNFPSFIRKTDRERIQNLNRSLEKWTENSSVWQITEKMDGSSITIFTNEGKVGVCSRNLELKEEEGNTFWDTAHKSGLVRHLELLNGKVNLAVQGELVGPNIQGNPYKLNDFEIYVYDIFNIDTQEYMSPGMVEAFCTVSGFKHVPVVGTLILHKNSPRTIQSLLDDAVGQSVVGSKPKREGLVFKNLNGQDSFKAISNEWLLKNSDK